MNRRKSDTRTVAAALVTMVIAFLVISALGGRGWNEESARFIVRITARISVGLFLVALAWDDAVALLLSRTLQRPARNRPSYFVGFAVSHAFHLAALVSLAVWFPVPFIDDVEWLTLIGGGLAYVFIFGIAIWYCLRGSVPEPPLVMTGLAYIWVVFTRAYGTRVPDSAGYGLIFAMLVAAALVELLAFRARRREA